MIYKKIYLRDEYKFLKDSEAFLEIFSYENGNDYKEDYLRYPLLILPGGAYWYCSSREKDPVAFAFLAQGFNCFALTYTCGKQYPAPQLEVAFAMDYIEKHTKEYSLYANSKSLVGFSAGGHLAASYSCYYEELANLAGLNANYIKPIYQILGYPVVSMLNSTHGDSRDTICGNDKDLLDKLSIERHITNKYPTTYIWTTKEDVVVPISNSVDLFNSLQKVGVKSKLHIYPHGVHGRSVATNETELSTNPLPRWMVNMQKWVSEATDFFYKTK